MKTFQDDAGHTWTVQIAAGDIKRIRSLLGVNLLDVLDDGCKLLAELHDDPVLLVDVIYCLCQPEADARNVTDEEFGRAMSGDALLHALNALLESLGDFFPSARQRAMFRDLVSKTNKVVDRLLDHAQTTLDGLDPESVAKSAIDSSGSFQESSG